MWIRIDEKIVDRVTKALTATGDPALAALAADIAIEAREVASPERAALLDRARDIYGEEGDREVTIDSDAAISESDEHDFVMAWVYVRHACRLCGKTLPEGDETYDGLNEACADKVAAYMESHGLPNDENGRDQAIAALQADTKESEAP